MYFKKDVCRHLVYKLDTTIEFVPSTLDNKKNPGEDCGAVTKALPAFNFNQKNSSMLCIGVNKIKIHFDTSQLCCGVVHSPEKLQILAESDDQALSKDSP